MHWLAPDLAIGSLYLDSDKGALDRAGIRAVLQLCEGTEAWCPHWRVLHLPVGDGQPVPCATLAEIACDFCTCRNGKPFLRRAGCAFVQAQRAAGRPTLIACLMGQSRAPAFALACLLAAQDPRTGLAPGEAWRLLRREHPGAAPHPYVLQSVLDCCGAGLRVNNLYALTESE